jgi:hypothetical protein
MVICAAPLLFGAGRTWRSREKRVPFPLNAFFLLYAPRCRSDAGVDLATVPTLSPGFAV